MSACSAASRIASSGSGFGSKSRVYLEEILIAHASRLSVG